MINRDRGPERLRANQTQTVRAATGPYGKRREAQKHPAVGNPPVIATRLRRFFRKAKEVSGLKSSMKLSCSYLVGKT
jgi:hypothetical protein